MVVVTILLKFSKTEFRRKSKLRGRDNDITIVVHICIVLVNFQMSLTYPLSHFKFKRVPLQVPLISFLGLHPRKIIQNENKGWKNAYEIR